MKILVSSFDRLLIEKLQYLLSGENVIFVKNGEEAIRNAPKDIDIIIYDAVSGLVSENDLNSLFEKAYRNSKYIVLMDDLFPIDPDNLKIPGKIVISRDRELSVLPELIKKYKELTIAPGINTSKNESKDEHSLKSQKNYENYQEPHTGVEISVISKDKELLDNITSALENIAYIKIFSPEQVNKGEILNSDIIIYDTTEGVSAAKELINMYQNANIPVIIVLDDMFPIDISRIPIVKKVGIVKTEIKNSLKTIVLKLISEYNISSRKAKKGLDKISEVLAMDSSKSHLKDIIVDVLKEEIRNSVRDSLSGIDFKELAKNAIQSQIATEDIKSLMLNSVNEIVNNMRNEIMNIATKEIETAIKEEDIKAIIREITTTILKERIDSLLA
jgi:histone H3/H4/CheY-like chemotaxis protein